MHWVSILMDIILVFEQHMCYLTSIFFTCDYYLDMRKALSRDVEKKSVIPLKRPVTPDELEYD